ncbi:unnamed protein product [Candidula unifasciata]|uniref:FH2 domain-containing protein n=1 Tax=Candidula unifasciata TaxID=100452 RepID=A0A8S3YKJ8_9EUPU|nr:unnamed protein product [Candidula unifasciata]
MDAQQCCEKTMPFVQDRQFPIEPSSPQSPVFSERDPFAGSAAALRQKLEKQGGKSSSLKAYRAQGDFQKPSPGSAVAHAVLKSCLSQESALQIQQRMPGDDSRLSYDIGIEGSSEGKTSDPSGQGVHRPAVSPPGICTQPQKVKKRMPLMPPPPLPPSVHVGNAPGAPPLPPSCPPPLPPLGTSHQAHLVSHCKLKQVHWVKVHSNQIAASLWRNVWDLTDQLDLAELEDQFSIKEKKTVAAKPKLQEDKEMLIDSKRAQNLGILFCGLRTENVRKLTSALNSTTEVDSFPADKMAAFKRYQPTSDDREMYKGCTQRQDSLHHVDQFMLELCQIPNLSLRLDLTLTLWEFPDHYASLEEEINDLLSGCEEILTSTELPTVLEFLLAIGNYMNSVWSHRQGIQGFQISSVEKILSVKGRDPQVTLCTYLVKQIKKSQPELLNWPKSLGHVSRCAAYAVKAVGAEIDVLKNDLQKMKKILKVLRNSFGLEDKMDRKFETDTQNFIVEYDLKLQQLDVRYNKVMDKHKQLLVRFGEPCGKTTESIFSHISQLMETFQQAVDKLQL